MSSQFKWSKCLRGLSVMGRDVLGVDVSRGRDVIESSLLDRRRGGTQMCQHNSM
jgi:hypothetical protein